VFYSLTQNVSPFVWVFHQFINLDLLSSTERAEMCHHLAGPYRNLLFFLRSAYIDPISMPTLAAAYLRSSYAAWKGAVGGAFAALDIPDDFTVEVLLLFIYVESMGGTRLSDGSAELPNAAVPSTWDKWAGSGLIRLQREHGSSGKCRVHFPYHFAQQYLKETITFIDDRYLTRLLSHLGAAMDTGAKGQGYCYQYALALELYMGACWENSLLYYVVKQLGDNLCPVQPQPPLSTFETDGEAEKHLDAGRMCVSIDRKTGIEYTKLGDFGCLLKNHGNNQTLRLRAEIKFIGHATQTDEQHQKAIHKLHSECIKFFGKVV